MNNLSQTNIISDWESAELNHPSNTNIKASPDFSGQAASRRSTDIFCLLVFIVFNAGLAVISYYIYIVGDINRLGHGSDFRGNVCGINALNSREFTYYPDPSDLLISLCLESCPNQTTSESICYYDSAGKTIKDYLCWDSIPCTSFGFYCLPGDSSRGKIIDLVYTSENLIKRGGGDLIKVLFIQVWKVALVSLMISFIYSLIFTMSVFSAGKRYLDRLKVFTFYSIFQNILLIPACGYLVYLNSEYFKSVFCETRNQVTPSSCFSTPQFGLYILIGVITFLYIGYLAFTVVYRRSLVLCSKVFDLTTELVLKVKAIALIPLFIVVIASVIFLGLYTLTLSTFGIGKIVQFNDKNVPGGLVNKLEFSSTDRLVLSYVIFMFFWWLSLILSASEFIIGGVVSSWYFTREKSLLYSPLSLSIKHCFRYHLGSIVRGSLFNLLLKLPALLISFLNSFIFSHKTKSCFICAAYICWPCLSLYQSFLKYGSSSTYLFQSIFGQNYSSASKKVFFFKKRHQAEISSQTTHAYICIFHIKLCISLPSFIAIYSFLLFSNNSLINSSNLTTPLSPSIFVLVISISISSIYAAFLYTLVEALAFCVSADCEMFSNEQRFIKKDENFISDQAEQPIETQRPGRSARLPVNFLQFDSNLNAKVSPSIRDLHITEYNP